MIGSRVPSTFQISSTEVVTDFEGFEGLWNIGHERDENRTYNRDALRRTGVFQELEHFTNCLARIQVDA
jgi:hypothetical protein